ncbi:hypothetical protein [Paenibacillus tuaregi]|uniref:hypothetical protein n=1 Tax=Paenibacillus tuaregi TaxID=1816681 RepID=UPI00083867FA|nr:hypothetical protein [Paenibacillus tuaregi]
MFNFFYSLTPEQWSAMGQWVGSIGTVWAVVVSLRLAREARFNSKPRLNIKSWKGIADGQEYLTIKLVNVGLVPTTIESCYLKIIRIWGPDKPAVDELAMKNNFPLRLEPASSTELVVTTLELIWIKNFNKIKKGQVLEIVFVDSLNNTFVHNFYVN